MTNRFLGLRRSLLLGLALLMVGAAAAYLISSLDVGTTARANESYQRVTVHYRRYGPAADLIARENGPETRVTRLTYSLSPGGNLESAQATLENEAGQVLQRAQYSNGHQTLELGSLPQIIDIRPFSLTDGKSRAAESSARKRALVSSGGLEIISEDGARTVLRAKADLPSIRASGSGIIPPDAYTIPYVADLSVSDTYSIIVVDSKTFATVSMKTFAVTPDGDILVESQEVISDSTGLFQQETAR